MDRFPIKNTDRDSTRFWIIVPAAGSGRRMGASVAKQYLRIGTRTILELTIERLHRLPNIEKIILVLQPDDSSWKFLKTSHYPNIETVAGGDERYHSVLNGLDHLADAARDRDWVLVHDAVRPCVAVEDMAHLVDTLADNPVGGILASPVRETLKKSNHQGIILETQDRSDLWLAATPQMFRYGILREAMETAVRHRTRITDEASAVEALGHKVRLIQGRNDNIKITHPEDLRLAEFILENQKGGD